MRHGKTMGLLMIAALCATAAVSGWSDVLFLDDGTILIGTIIGTDSTQTRYHVFDRDAVVSTQDIRRSESDLKTLDKLPIKVELMEGSALNGTFADYDPDIGLFLDIAFGALTIPNESIKTIVDPAQRARYYGSSFLVRAGASLYFPILDSAEAFGSDAALGLTVQWSVPLLRGLTAGFDVQYSFANLTSGEDVQYNLISVQPEIGYRLLFWRTNKNFLNMLTPFFSIGAGPVYVNFSDSAASPSERGELNAGLNTKIGLDIEISGGWGLRFQGRADLILQEGSPFTTISVGLMASYDR